MRPSTRRAVFISLCLHVIAWIVTISLLHEQLEEEFMAALVVDIISVPKERKPPPKLRIDPVVSAPRHQMGRGARIISPQSRPVKPTEPLFPRTQPLTLDEPRYRLEAAQIAQTQTDLSTATRALRAEATTLPHTESATPPTVGGRGLNTLGTPSVQREPNRQSLLEAIEEEVEGDTVMRPLNLIGPGRLAAPHIGFDQVMKNLAKEIVKSSEGGPIDVVFVVDSSGSMGDNIRAVGRHLSEMINVYKSAKLDYALGLTQFWAPGRPSRNEIKVFQLTKDMREYQQEIGRMQPRQDEHALDAMEETIREMRFRPTSKKHLILVTDEPFTSLKGLTVKNTIASCREFYIYVNVLGLDTDEHRKLATETGGSWHAIPQDPVEPSQNPRLITPGRSRYNARALRNAQWTGVAEMGKVPLKNLPTNMLDVILFIDGSKSMEDKLPEFLAQLEGVIRDWDNALIDYQIGVVRFRTGTGTFNFINVFQPPQTLEDIRKIASLPCEGNEQLLDAIVEGMQKLKLRPQAQPYLILVTDEPSTGNYSSQAVIQLCLKVGAKVGVIGTFDPFQQEVALRTHGVWVPIPDGKTTNSLNW